MSANSAIRSLGPGRAAVAAVVLAAVLAAVAAGFWPWRPGHTAAGTVELGHLPGGVSRQALNVLVVTLDTATHEIFGTLTAREYAKKRSAK